MEERTGSAPPSQDQDTAQAVKEQGRRMGETAKQEGRELAGEARDRARTVLEESRSQVRHEAEKQMGTAASALRESGRQMEEMASHGEGMVADVTRGLGSGMRRLGERIDERGLDGVMEDVTRYARQNPGTFLLGAAALGFLAGRVVRNMGSDGSRQQGRQEQYQTPYQSVETGTERVSTTPETRVAP